jgi:hypothetical protein
VSEDSPLVEVQVSGKAKEIVDPGAHQLAERIANSPVVIASYVLFEFQVSHVLVVEYDHNQRPIVRRWKGESISNQEINDLWFIINIGVRIGSCQ